MAYAMHTPATFTVQLVRMHQHHAPYNGAARAPSLQVLNKVFCMRIAPSCLTLVVANSVPRTPAHTPSILRYFAPVRPPALSLRLPIASSSSEHRETRVWLSVRAGLVTSVRVKGRMLRVAMHDRQTLRLRVKDADRALEAATAMMEAWGVEPLVETAAGNADVHTATPSMAQLSKLYVHCAQFRALVHDLHNHIETLEADNNDDEHRDAAMAIVSL